MPAIQGRTTARTTQTAETRAEPVTDAHIDHAPPAAQPVSPCLPWNKTPRSCGIQLIPARPRQATPVRSERITATTVLTHDSILPRTLPLNQSTLIPATAAPDRSRRLLRTPADDERQRQTRCPNAKLVAQSHRSGQL